MKGAGAEAANGFASAMSSDAENIYIVLTARPFPSDLKIIARASEEEATSKLLRADTSLALAALLRWQPYGTTLASAKCSRLS